MSEAVAAGLATAVAASTLIGAYTGLVQKFDKLEAGQRALETGQRALETGQQENKSELKDFKAGQKSLELGLQDNKGELREFKAEVRGDLTIVGCISVAGFAFVLLVMKQPQVL